MEKWQKPLRVILSLLAVLAIFFGFCGFFLSAHNSLRTDVAFLEKQSPLHDINAIAIDSYGNIYYGNGDRSAIQVYDNTGEFVYGFSFPTGPGYFVFYIDSADYIHIATLRTNCTYTFLYGELIETREYKDSREESEITDQYKSMSRQSKEFRDANGNTYIVKSNYKVDMYDSAGNYLRTVSANAPIWPFSPHGYWYIAATGLITLFLANKKAIINLFRAV